MRASPDPGLLGLEERASTRNRIFTGRGEGARGGVTLPLARPRFEFSARPLFLRGRARPEDETDRNGTFEELDEHEDRLGTPAGLRSRSASTISKLCPEMCGHVRSRTHPYLKLIVSTSSAILSGRCQNSREQIALRVNAQLLAWARHGCGEIKTGKSGEK
ncbi:hypothetical protein KM043_006413 [Ampulex compressa]|nr:hypothetical protein KM043_006413 [Ampulex compressa]